MDYSLSLLALLVLGCPTHTHTYTHTNCQQELCWNTWHTFLHPHSHFHSFVSCKLQQQSHRRTVYMFVFDTLQKRMLGWGDWNYHERKLYNYLSCVLCVLYVRDHVDIMQYHTSAVAFGRLEQILCPTSSLVAYLIGQRTASRYAKLRMFISELMVHNFAHLSQEPHLY